MKLTPKQADFCDYYIKYGDATKAAIEAGYSEDSARFIGCENLTKPNIREYINKRLEEEREKRVASADEVMAFFTGVMRGEILEPNEQAPRIDTRVNAAKELMKRYNAAEGRNQSSLEKLDALLKEFNDAVKEDKENE